MFTISAKAMEALEADAERGGQARFVQWWHRYGQLLGQAAPDVLMAGYERHLIEAEFAGLDAEEDVFPFVAGRMVIPQCEGDPYEALLNLVCDDGLDEAAKVVAIAAMAGHSVR